MFVFGVLYEFLYDGTFSPFSSALALFFAFMLFFVGLFGLIHLFNSWTLESNSWVVDVKEMNFLFNPMYWNWLFYHDHKKWAKWNILFCSVSTVFFVTLFGTIFAFILSTLPITPQSFWIGWAIAVALMVPFTISWYLYYTSVDRTPSPFPKGRLTDLPSRL
jgi:hypothetical protein